MGQPKPPVLPFRSGVGRAAPSGCRRAWSPRCCSGARSAPGRSSPLMPPWPDSAFPKTASAPGPASRAFATSPLTWCRSCSSRPPAPTPSAGPCSPRRSPPPETPSPSGPTEEPSVMRCAFARPPGRGPAHGPEDREARNGDRRSGGQGTGSHAAVPPRRGLPRRPGQGRHRALGRPASHRPPGDHGHAAHTRTPGRGADQAGGRQRVRRGCRPDGPTHRGLIIRTQRSRHREALPPGEDGRASVCRVYIPRGCLDTRTRVMIRSRSRSITSTSSA